MCYQWPHPNPDLGLLIIDSPPPPKKKTLVSCMVWNQWHPPKPWPWFPVWCGIRNTYPDPDLGLRCGVWSVTPTQTLTLVSLSVTPTQTLTLVSLSVTPTQTLTLVSCIVCYQWHPPKLWLSSPLWCVISDTHPNPDLDLLISKPTQTLTLVSLSVTPTQTLTLVSCIVCYQWHPPKLWLSSPLWCVISDTHPNPDLDLLISKPTQTLTLVSLSVTPTQTLTLVSCIVCYQWHPPKLWLSSPLWCVISDTNPNPDLGLLITEPTQTLTFVSLPVTPTQTLTLTSLSVNPPKPWPWSPYQWHPLKPWPWSPYQWHPPKPWPWSPVWCVISDTHPNPDLGLLYGVEESVVAVPQERTHESAVGAGPPLHQHAPQHAPRERVLAFDLRQQALLQLRENAVLQQHGDHVLRIHSVLDQLRVGAQPSGVLVGIFGGLRGFPPLR